MTSADPNDPKTVLRRYLQSSREALVWKLEGLSEREARWPRTPTGTNLLGLVKHAAGIEIGYFGDTFGRPWPDPAEVPWTDWEAAEPNSDLYATADESVEGIVALYRRVWEFADETITTLPLDAHGRVPWWSPGNADVTLHRILVHVIEELGRHAGHADIIRELHDHSVGLPDDEELGRHAGHADIIRELHDHSVGLDRRWSNLPEWDDDVWAEYTAKLRGIAEQFPA